MTHILTKKDQSLDQKDALIIAGQRFQSRLIIGTGKYKTYQQNAEA